MQRSPGEAGDRCAEPAAERPGGEDGCVADGEAGAERGAPLHSETPGLMIDRLSILALKIYHTREEAHTGERHGGASGAECGAAGVAGGAAGRIWLGAWMRLWAEVLDGNAAVQALSADEDV